MTDVTVSVRELVAFCHRSGSIDHRFQPSPSAADGQRGHREVTAGRPDSYRAEYPLEYRRDGPRRRLLLRGRADGVDSAAALVEEIKTCRIDPARMPEALSRQHLAQGRLYAAMLAAAEGLPAVTVRLVWYQLDERREHVLEQRYTAAELGAFLASSLDRWEHWLDALARHRSARDASIDALAFPHGAYRPGQRAAAELVYRCIDRGGQLLLEAPTGIGKTMASLYPALKALSRNKHDRLVFCTARHTGRRAAEEALVRLEAGGLHCTRLSLTARERICFSPGRACRPEECRFARGYYDKLPAAREEALQLARLDQPALEALARRHDLCPYQLGLDLLPWSDLVIADQHYVFGLGAAFGTLAAERGERWSVLVDEAHNLPERARAMYSAALDGALLRRARRAARGRLRRALAAVEDSLGALAAAAPGDADDVRTFAAPPPSALEALQAFTVAAAETLLRRPGLLAAPGPLQDVWFEALAFLRVAENRGADYRCELAAPANGAAPTLALNCIDPARLLARRHGAMHATVAFSATLSPAEWMRDRLGLGPAAVWHRCPSPFAPEQLRVHIDGTVDTRWRAREATRAALVQRILAWAREHPGNCLVFFPSYRYLEDCRELLDAGARADGRRPWVQEPAPATDLLALLAAETAVLGLCILGGGYSEGVDLPGDQLRSVVIVGAGLPQLGRETRLQRDWYAGRGVDGFAFACLYPALQRVNQALGRVVRGPGDRGAALLIDPRYREPAYRGLLAPQWCYRASPPAIPPRAGSGGR
jgi:DNA excision repair protein ERCC-2